MTTTGWSSSATCFALCGRSKQAAGPQCRSAGLSSSHAEAITPQQGMLDQAMHVDELADTLSLKPKTSVPLMQPLTCNPPSIHVSNLWQHGLSGLSGLLLCLARMLGLHRMLGR